MKRQTVFQGDDEYNSLLALACSEQKSIYSS